MANEAEKTLHKMQQVLTIDANGAYETEEDKAELLWHERRTHTAVNGYCPVH